MKLFSFLAILLLFTLLPSSRSEDSDNSDYGSGVEGNEEYGSGDPSYEGEPFSSETPGTVDEEEVNKINEDGTYVGKEDEISFGGDPAHTNAEVKTSENMEGRPGEFSLRHPAILALIIGGIIFVLLIVLLLIMFVVYRLRKKDEGSYALDENMKKKSRNIIYTKPPLQNEFFA